MLEETVSKKSAAERMTFWLNEEVISVIGETEHKSTRVFRMAFGMFLSNDEDLSNKLFNVVAEAYEDLMVVRGMDIVFPGLEKEIFDPEFKLAFERMLVWMEEVFKR